MENPASLKETRASLGLTQKEAAKLLGVSLRSYLTYENDPIKSGSIKHAYMLGKLNDLARLDEEHGILSIQKISAVLRDILPKYRIDYCYLFGSYAKNKAKENSDVDLLVSSAPRGLGFYGLVEELREALHKKVDVLSIDQISNNTELLGEILKDGVKIYG